MEWVELILPAGELVDEIAAIVASTDDVAASGAQVRGTDVILWAPVGEADAAVLALRRAAARLRAEGFEVDPATVRVVPAAPEDEWRDAWKKHFHVTRIGARIVIVPSWETHAPAAGDVVLDLDPGRAFGTGAHATTRLCLLELDRLAAEGAAIGRFLDVGTGSGILSIAAAKLWPDAGGVAIDVDPLAVSCAIENLERNGVVSRVRVSDDGVEDLGGTFDVIVANIQADILETLRDPILSRLAADGTLVLSGLLVDQAPPVAAHYEKAGMRTIRRSGPSDDTEWASVMMRRTAGASAK